MLWRAGRLRVVAFQRHIRSDIARGYQRRLLCISTSLPNIATILDTDPALANETITATGWVRTIRKHKRVTFLELGDGSTSRTLHAVLQPSSSEGLSTGTSVALRGNWRHAPEGAKQKFELDATEVTVQGLADENFPLQKKFHSPEFLRTVPHIRLRTPLHSVLTRMRSEADHYVSTFFRDQDFVRVQPPIITSSDCEGAGEVFGVTARDSSVREGESESPSDVPEFFKSVKYLTVSSQLHLEAYVHEHPKVWSLSPTFRAEKSDTPRHLSEFWMLEAEVRTQNLGEVMSLVERLIHCLIKGLESSRLPVELATAKAKTTQSDLESVLETINNRWSCITSTSWPRITYEQAVQGLRTAVGQGRATFTVLPLAEEGLRLEHEQWIANEVGQGLPVFVTNYPSAVKPFYMSSIDGGHGISPDKQQAACFDLLLPETCEIAGGSLREHRLEVIKRKMQAKGSNSDNLNWYLDLRRYGSVPHGGFGLGLDRLLAYLAGLDNIKDVVAWPRHFGHCYG